MSKNVEQQILDLSKELREHNYAYYNLDKPTISDFDFDSKLKQLQTLEEKFPEFAMENSPTKRVGGTITKNFKNETHLFPMLSLANTYNKEELIEFDERIKKLTGREKVEYVCELKYDGAAVSLYYENGEFVSAKTRGDGILGDVISENIKTIGSIPLQLRGNDYPDNFEIRGEVIFKLDGFKKLNKQRIEQGEEPFANPRNTASGTIKMQDSSVVASRDLDCFLYSLKSESKFKNTHLEDLEAAKEAGFKVPNYYEKCSDINQVWDYINKWEEKKKELNFEIDGIVIKLNNIQDQEELGNTAKSPRWAISYKYPAERQISQLINIDYQIGRTGAITPVANLKPVQIAGTTVRRASLHNAQIIDQLDLYEQDWVWVEKGGEIIPKITGVIKEKRQKEAVKVQFIDTCPFCSSTLVQKEGEANHYCLNTENCSPQILTSLEHFVSRKAMKIEGLGSEKIKILFDHGFVRNPADFYTLKDKKEDLIGLTKYIETEESGFSYNNKLQIPLDKILYALEIGKLTLKEIKQIEFNTLSWKDLKEDSFLKTLPSNKRTKFINQYNNYPIHVNSDIAGYLSVNDFLELLLVNEMFKPELSTFSDCKYVDNYLDDLIIQYPSKLALLERIFSKISDRRKVSIQQKSVDNILKSVDNSKSKPFNKVLFSLGIRHVGENVAKVLAKHYGSIDKLKIASFEELQNIDEIGDVIAKTVYEWFKVDENINLINNLKNHGLQFENSVEETENTTDILSGKKIVVSGVFNSLSRNELKTLIENNGGKNVSSISKSTDYLVAGEKMGPSKLKKAEDLKITILNEMEFLDLVKQ